MKIGDKVKTPHGNGVIIKHIGKPPKGMRLVRLNKPIGMYNNFYYSKDELVIARPHF